MEAVQGKELERIFREEGVIDEDDDDAGKLNTDVSLTGPVQTSKDGIYTVYIHFICCYLWTSHQELFSLPGNTRLKAILENVFQLQLSM